MKTSRESILVLVGCLLLLIVSAAFVSLGICFWSAGVSQQTQNLRPLSR